LIYISIPATVQRAIDDGRLLVLEPEFASDPVERLMAIHPELKADLERADKIPRLGKLKADLEAFMLGQEVTMCFEPRKHRSAYMGLLEPASRGIWDIRGRDPSPGIRVFGAFAAKDVFVGLHWLPRSRSIEGSNKEPLGDDENRWQFAMIETETRWARELPGLRPVIGGKPNELLSKKVRSA
jgi:hypothetical protein